MSDWVGELTAALQDEFGDRPHVCTMATVDKNGAPRARSVVCRKVGADGSLWIASDARSEKNEHLKAIPQAEIVFWLSGRREQFRILGSVKILGGSANEPARVDVWKTLSDSARALFSWPSPGAKRIDPPEAFAKETGSATPPPTQFEVVIVRPRRVEQLQLTAHPHRRRKWMLAGNWSAAAEMNP